MFPPLFSLHWISRTVSSAGILVFGLWTSFSFAAEPVAPLQPLPVAELSPEAQAAKLDQKLDLVYARYGERAMHLDLVRPKGATGPLPVIMLIHGGGWVNGNKTNDKKMAQQLALRGYATASIEYRLADEAKYPAAIQDCTAAVRWLRGHAAEYGLEPNKMGAVGFSAGAHLVGLMSAAPQVKEFQADSGNDDLGKISCEIQAAVPIAGPYELATGPIANLSRTKPDFYTNRWLGKVVDEAPDLYRIASPFTHLSAKHPPTLFITSEDDDPTQNLNAFKTLQKLGGTTSLQYYPEGKHGCWTTHPWFEPMLNDFEAFFALHLGKTEAEAQLPRQKTAWGEIAIGAKHLELWVSSAPADGVVKIPRLNNPVGLIYAKTDAAKSPLNLNPGLTDWSISLPKLLDPQPTPEAPLQLVVETVGTPYFPTIPRIISPEPDGHLVLPAHQAVTHGELLRYEPQPHKNTVGYWANEKDTCQWQFFVEEPREFELHILQGCGKGQGGSEVAVLVGEEKVVFTVEDTGHFQNFKPRMVGKLKLAGPKFHTLRIVPLKKAAGAIMDVREVKLVPVVAAAKTITNSIGMKLVHLSAGEFAMGSPATEEGRGEDEQQHQVRLSKEFFIGQHEVTVGQFRQFVTATGYQTTGERDKKPGFGFWDEQQIIEELPQFNWQSNNLGQTDDHPVINTSWEDAQAFCVWLSKKEGKTVRLPTEAEWEYACRAGTTSRYSSGDTEASLQPVANLSDAAFLAKYKNATWSIEWNDGHAFTAPVGSFQANPWGLYDMHGNVWEWCQDWYAADTYTTAATAGTAVTDPTGPATGKIHVLRGGSFTNRNRFLRSADRDADRPRYRYNFTGFRVVQLP